MNTHATPRIIRLFSLVALVAASALRLQSADVDAGNPAIIPVPQPGMEERHLVKVAAARAHRYDLLMIGDSITHRFEAPAFRAVWDYYYGSRNAFNLGFGGARTENIQWNLANGQLENQSPKAVVLLIGTNNADDVNYPYVSTAEQIAEGTAAIIKLLRGRFPEAKILLLRIFPRTNLYYKADGTERGSMAQRAATCRRAGELTASLADNKQVFYLDINKVFLKADGSLDLRLMPDQLHPSPLGALAWARAMEPLLAKLMGDRPRDPVTPALARMEAGPNAERTVISVADYGARPDDDTDDTQGLREAVGFARTHPGTTLKFPPGVYRLRDEQAVKLMEDIMSGRIEATTIFKPYYPYVKGLDFTGASDLMIDGAGATLLCEGWMEPLSFTRCRDVTIRGLTIDYDRKPNSVGTITEIQPDAYEASFDPHYPLSATMPLCRVTYWDPVARRVLGPVQYFPKYDLIGPNRLRVHAKIPAEFKGYRVVAIHTLHFRPAVLLLDSAQMTIEDVTIHAQPGMGIVGQHSEDLTMRGVRIVPAAGDVVSTNTDATHFVSCAGYLNLENCQFEGQGDDCLNVHNYYYNLRRAERAYDLYLTKVDLHAGVLDYPDLGDRLELVDRQSLAVVKTVIVTSRENNEAGMFSRVTFDGAVPDNLENYLVINVTRLPKVRVIGCVVTSNLARGFLIKGRDVAIERCLIRETTGTGIKIGAEGQWHEGPGSAGVTIRYNRFIRCGGGEGTIDGASAIAVSVQSEKAAEPGVHRDILIEGNVIEGSNSPVAISIAGADQVTIRHNEIEGCATPVQVCAATNVMIEHNAGAKDQVIALITMNGRATRQVQGIGQSGGSTSPQPKR
jgi:lysophospholipase L1-like esterase